MAFDLAGRRPRRRAPGLASLSPQLQRLVLAAVASHGDLTAVARALGLSERTVRARLSVLRRLGLARRVRSFSPPAAGRPIECLNLVQLHLPGPATMAAFEAACREDPCVTAAARVCGRFDYQLTSFHADVREANIWRRVLEAREEVGRVEQRRVETRFGHPLAGLPLLARRGGLQAD